MSGVSDRDSTPPRSPAQRSAQSPSESSTRSRDSTTATTPPRNSTPQARTFVDPQINEESTASDSIQRKAAEVLEKIDTSKSPNALKDNIELILEATTPSPLRATTASRLNARVATPSTSLRRKRNRDDIQDESYDVPSNAEETAANQRPLKRLKMRNTIKVHPPVDVVELNPNPLQITYQTHPLKDRNDAFYTEAFRRLFRQTENMVSTYFCIHNLDQGEFFEPWADVEFTPEFINWAEQVAEPDPNIGWNELLRSTTHRKWFLMGVIMRILKVRVFDEDLFGANQQQKELLFGIERALFTQEGFSRTALRAETCRTIIAENPVTEFFYVQVAELTAQISLLLQPLTRYLYAFVPPHGKVLPKIQDLYQSLHNIVSTAAYLSLGIRLSPTIFFFTEIHPGTVFDTDDQHSLELQIYTDSKRAVLDDFSELYTNADSPYRQREAALMNDLAAQPDQTSKEWKKANSALTQLRNSLPPPPGYTHRAKTKIAVWPAITRFKAGAAGEDEKPLAERDGFRIYPICKSAVVCYFGESDESKQRKREDEKLRTGEEPVVVKESLRKFVRERKKSRGVGGGNGGGVGAGLAAAVVAIGAAAYLYGVPEGANEMIEVFGNDLVRIFGNVMEYAGEVVDKLGLLREAARTW